jgi:hypothetical protein
VRRTGSNGVVLVWTKRLNIPVLSHATKASAWALIHVLAGRLAHSRP